MRYICHGCEVSCTLDMHSSTLWEYMDTTGLIGYLSCPLGHNSFRCMFVQYPEIQTKREEKELRIAELITERDTYHERLKEAHTKTEEWRVKAQCQAAYPEAVDIERAIEAAELKGYDRAVETMKEMLGVSND